MAVCLDAVFGVLEVVVIGFEGIEDGVVDWDFVVADDDAVGDAAIGAIDGHPGVLSDLAYGVSLLWVDADDLANEVFGWL